MPTCPTTVVSCHPTLRGTRGLLHLRVISTTSCTRRRSQVLCRTPTSHTRRPIPHILLFCTITDVVVVLFTLNLLLNLSTVCMMVRSSKPPCHRVTIDREQPAHPSLDESFPPLTSDTATTASSSPPSLSRVSQRLVSASSTNFVLVKSDSDLERSVGTVLK